MLDDLSKMMDQLQGTEKRIKKTQQNLENVLVEESSGKDRVKVSLSAAFEVKSIKIKNNLVTDMEELEDHLIIALNKALKKAHTIREKEIEKASQSGLSDLLN